MKTSVALKLVKKCLATSDGRSNKEIYVCYAAREARDRGYISTEKHYYIKDHIDLLLGATPSLETWLLRVHRIPFNCSNVEYRNKMQVTRHAWVDNMIAEFQAKGD
jgi:hypothetical protein